MIIFISFKSRVRNRRPPIKNPSTFSTECLLKYRIDLLLVLLIQYLTHLHLLLITQLMSLHAPDRFHEHALLLRKFHALKELALTFRR